MTIWPPPTDHQQHRSDSPSWPADCGVFLLWGLAGLAAIGVLAGAFTIGVFFVPAAYLLVALAAWRTFRRSGRAYCVTGLLLCPAAAIALIGSWSTFQSSSRFDDCHATSNGEECSASVHVDASGHQTDVAAPHADATFHLSAALPYLGAGTALALIAVLLFVALGVRARRRPRVADFGRSAGWDHHMGRQE